MKKNALTGMLVLMFSVFMCGCSGIIDEIDGEIFREQYNKTESAEGIEKISINTNNGSVNFEFTEDDEISIAAEKRVVALTLDNATDYAWMIEIEVERKDNELVIEVHAPERKSYKVNYSVNFEINAPKDIVIDVDTTNGAISLEPGAKNISLKTTNGTIRAAGVTEGENYIKTTNGSVSATEIAGPMIISTMNGTVISKDCTGDAEITTSNGMIQYEINEFLAGNVSLKTSNGAVKVKIPEDSDVELAASTTNGKITPSFQLKNQEKEKNSLKGILNAGKYRLNVRTTNGKIDIGKN